MTFINQVTDGTNLVSGSYAHNHLQETLYSIGDYLNFSSYLPTDPNKYCLKTFAWTFGESGF